MASREVIPGVGAIYKNYGEGTVVSTSEKSILSGHVWGTSGYFEISPSGHTYEYDFVYDNTKDSLLYIGFERYDANKTSTSNNSTVYFVSSSSAASNKRVKGTINLATDSNGNETKYIKLRILGNWNNNVSNAVAVIKSCSLREVSSYESVNFNKNGIITSDVFRENGLNSAFIHKEGVIECSNFIEY